jgi:cytochrome c-type biogenesis protein
MEYILAYAAGLITLVNPCVLPVVPIVIGSALSAHRLGPLVLTAGMSLSFVSFGLLVTSFGYAIGLTEELLAQIGAVIMLGFALVLLVPQINAGFATATAGFSARADAGFSAAPTGLGGQFAGGLLLGAIWSPCIGPTLGGAIALAAQGQSIFHAATVLAAYALGISSLMLALAFGLRATALKRLSSAAKPIMGVAFLLVGLGILTGANHMIEAWALDHMPTWLVDFSVSI